MLTISGVGSKKEAEAKDIIEVSEEFVILWDTKDKLT